MLLIYAIEVQQVERRQSNTHVKLRQNWTERGTGSVVKMKS